ncbi:MAG: CusA/CzcA family heavy metal efflux RND transporter [Myxococcota bacterium]
MIGRLIEACARRPFITLLFTVAVAGWGWFALGQTPLDAIPDISDTQVIVYTEWPGRSADLVESQVTQRLSAALLSTAKVRSVRGQSFFGSSFVWVIFEDGTDLYWARTRVFENVQKAAPRLPDGVRPVLGPDATGVGWVFQYALVDRSGHTSLDGLRAIQDFRLRPQLESVPGVAEVASVGGFARTWQIALDPLRMAARNVSLADVEMAVKAANEDVGGEALEVAEHEQVVVGRGLLTKPADLAAVVLRAGADGETVTLGDVGEVEVVPEARRGIAELDGQGEVVGGIIVMRDGENALSVIERVKARLDTLREGLPTGVRLEVTYDRSELIEAAVGTLKESLLEEMLVVSLIILVFLLHVRSALVPILTLPVAVLCAFIPMAAGGLTTNIMSLGGIIIAIGDMVDGAIVVIENVHKRLEEWDADGNPRPDAADGSGPISAKEARRRIIIDAMKEVGPSIFGSLLVLTVAFVPILTLASTEGRLFRPLAATKTFAMGFASILAVTATPALVALLVKGKILPERKHILTRAIVAAYVPIVRFVVNHRWLVVGLAGGIIALTVPAFLRLEPEFMPPLEEMDLLYMPTAPAGMPDAVATRALQTMNAIIAQVPEVEHVFGKAGRADTATDPAPMSMFETVVKLKPKSEWRPGVTMATIKDELDKELTVPGMPNIWWMPVQTRLEMLSTGLRSNLGVKVFGPDPATIERGAVIIERALGAVPGTRAATAERDASSFYLELQVDRAAAARYGLNTADVGRAIETAVAGMPITEALPRGADARQRFAVSARYAREWRDDPDALERVLLPAGEGRVVALGQIAKIVPTTSPMSIRSESGQIVGYVLVDVDERVRSIPDYVAEAEQVLAKVELPTGVHKVFAGQFESWERASQRLVLVGLATLLLVIGLLYWNTRSAVETSIVLLAVPFSLVGAVWMVWALDYHLSVAVWVGLIALAGLDAETGVVMLLYLTLSHRRRQEAGTLKTQADLLDVIVEGAARRIRPKLMTILVNIVGLAPVLVSTGIGADVMKRVAVPLFGGVVTSFLLELTVYPALFAIWKGYRRTAP